MSATKIQGRVPVTPMQVRKRAGGSGGSGGGGALITRVPVAYEYVAADLTADGALWYVDVTHNLSTTAVLFMVYDGSTGTNIEWEKAHFGANALRLWLSHDWPAFTVVLL